MTGIRVATRLDRDEVRGIYLAAFPASERQVVATLAVDLLGAAASHDTIALVAESGGSLVGHVAFSPVTAADNTDWTGCILAPLGVSPGYRQRGIGSKLIESGIERLSGSGVNVLFVYGDPAYYGRFGFSAAVAAGCSPPYPLQYPVGWQATVLNEGALPVVPAALSCLAPLCDPALW